MDKVIVLSTIATCARTASASPTPPNSVFLDLQARGRRWGHAVQALRRDVVTRICCFSPCIEQVLKTVTALNEHGFTDVETFESLVRTHESHASAGPQVSIDEAATNRIRVVEQRKESRRLIQIEKARAAKAHAQATIPTAHKLEAGHDASTTEGETLKRKHEGIVLASKTTAPRHRRRPTAPTPTLQRQRKQYRCRRIVPTRHPGRRRYHQEEGAPVANPVAAEPAHPTSERLLAALLHEVSLFIVP